MVGVCRALQNDGALKSLEKWQQPAGPQSLTIPVGDRTIVVETGRMGRHANGAVTVRDGDTIVYCTACAALEPSDPGDFAPLSVTYQERYSAAGRTSGGFFKREGRPKDHEVLVSRLMDRPLRPMVAKGFNFETQVLAWVLSYDGEHSPDSLAVIAAGAALAVSDIPVSGIVAGVRVGVVDSRMVVNPSVADMARSPLDLVVAGTADSVLMIEGYCEFFPEERLLEAVAVGQEAVAGICRALEGWARSSQGVGKPKMTHALGLPPPELEPSIVALVGADVGEAVRIRRKQERGKAMARIEERVLSALTAEGRARTLAAAASAVSAGSTAAAVELEADEKEEDEDAVEWYEAEGFVVEEGLVDEGEVHVKVRREASSVGAVGTAGPSGGGSIPPAALSRPLSQQVYTEADVKLVLKSVISQAMRRLIVTEGVRSDGRGVTEVRPIDSSCGLLPRAHGSALFTRGETQALVVAVVGSDDMAQRQDHLTAAEELKRFYLHYNFPPSSVGETGRIGVPSRREVGHGTLAERALAPAIPSSDAFPYSTRVESTITESNGSSSMASVCGGCLALLDAGVPLVSPVAGVAMGLILRTEEVGGSGRPVILTDILGSEDALGDMDFKVAGSESGVTAFQMDIKVTGITLDVMRAALEQARAGRLHVLGEMAKCSPPPRRALSAYAPRMEAIKIEADKVNVVIGSGGKTVRAIIEDTGVDSINVENNGQIKIYAKTEEAVLAAKSRIEGLTVEPEVGRIYRDCPVKTITPFGCFVEITPGKEGLVHISELAHKRLEKAEEVVAVGQTIDVQLIEINARGQLRLSRKALLEGGPPDAAGGNAAPTDAGEMVPPPSGGNGVAKGDTGAGSRGANRDGRPSSSARSGRRPRDASARGPHEPVPARTQ